MIIILFVTTLFASTSMNEIVVLPESDDNDDIQNETDEISQSGSINYQDQNPWGGFSVVASDNLDAFSLNPAGFGIDHGKQIGFYLASDNEGYISHKSPFYFASKMYGFGYSFQWNDGDKLFNATDVIISFGSMIGNNISFGSSWSKMNEDIKIGVMYRPLNILSFGFVSSCNETLTEIYSNRFGVAARPLSDNTLTVGLDLMIENDINSYMPFFEVTLGGGVSLKSSFAFESFDNLSFDNISSQFTLDVDFGKTGFYFTKPNINQSSDAYKNWGVGYHKSSNKKSTIFNTPKKNEKHFVRLALDGLFIEEKPGKKPFGFDPMSFASNQEKGKQLRFLLDEID